MRHPATRRVVSWLGLPVLLFSSLGACTGGGDPDGGGSPSPEPSTPAPTTFASPPDGAELEVVESGFSTSPYQDDESADLLSYGVVIGNPSEYLALDVFVQIRLLDADGEAIDEISGEPAAEPEPRRQPVTRVLPGERIGLGSTVPHYGREVAELAVEIETGKWSPVYPQFWWSHPVSAGGVTTSRSRERATLGFAVDAAYPPETIGGRLQITGHFTAIFRDGAGAVIGGADCCHGTEGLTPVEVPPGRSEAELYLDSGVPARADDSRTEVYLPDPQEDLP